MRKPDRYEQLARARLKPILGPLREIDPGGGPVQLHDFEAGLPDGSVAAIEVTGEVDPRQRALESAITRLPALTVPGSRWQWIIGLYTGAQVKGMGSPLRDLLSDMESQGLQKAHYRDDYRDPLVRRLRDLGIESVWAWPTAIPARRGKVTVGPGAFGGFAWGGSAVDKWLKDLLASPRGTNKLEKLRNASTATERHLVIVLDPHTEAGVCLPVGLIDFGQPGAAEEPLPALAVPEPL